MKGLKICLIMLAIVAMTGVAMAGTLQDVRAKGFIQAGVNGDLFGFGKADDKGVWKGLDVDTARAIAAAVFGDADKVKYTPLTAKTRFTALQSGEIDVLTRNCTQTLGRDTALGLDFVQVNYYDGQGFLVPKKLGVKSALELSGASICTQSGTTTELNLSDYFISKNMTFKPVVYESADEATVIYDTGRCDVYTTDASALAARRTGLSDPAAHIILPEIISKEPLGPAVRQGDQQWSDIVRWTLFALINAEELGITSQNVDEMKTSKNPSVQRFLGVDADYGQHLGLTADWAYRIVKHVGNYGEIFERNVGPNTALGLERGVNALWTNGGLMYAPPIR